MNTPISAAQVTAGQSFIRAAAPLATPPVYGVPFIPASVQLLPGTDAVTFGGATPYQIGRYLITNSFGQGEAANQSGNPPGFGGEIFEVDHDPATGASVTTNAYGGHTLSRPSNTSPLSQPAFAYRLQ